MFTHPNVHKYVNELIGTFFLVTTIGLVVKHTAVVGEYAPLLGALNGLAAPFAIASILMVMVYAGGHISGAHYNPAVTLGIWLRNRFSYHAIAPYFIFQCLGAAMAALTVPFFKSVIPTASSLNIVHLFLAEFLFTFALVYVVLNVATSKDTAGNSFYGAAIGFTVLAGAFAVGSISGAAFNPAVVLGLVIMGLIPFNHVPLYLVAQFLAGAVAAWVFNYLNPQDR